MDTENTDWNWLKDFRTEVSAHIEWSTKTHIELKTCCVWVRVFRVWKRRHVIENVGKVISCNFNHIISVKIHQHPTSFKDVFLSPTPHHHQDMKGVDPFAQMSSIGNEPGIRNVVSTSPAARHPGHPKSQSHVANPTWVHRSHQCGPVLLPAK